MDITYIPPEKQSILLLYSLMIGYISGLICGTIRTPADILNNTLLKNKRWRIVTDTVFDIIISVVFILITVTFIYAANEGIIRIFMITAAFCGIYLYKISLGKLQRKFNSALSAALYNIMVFASGLIKRMMYPLRSRVRSHGVLRYINKQMTPDRKR